MSEFRISALAGTAKAYVEGWDACFANPYPRHSEEACAWEHGFLDAMEAEDWEADCPQPEAAGYKTT